MRGEGKTLSGSGGRALSDAAAGGAAAGPAPRASREKWPRVKLGEICERGKTLSFEGRLEDACLLIADCPHTTAPDEGVGFPLVRTPNVGLGRLIYEKMHRVSEAVYNERIRRARPVAGDLIYAREAPAGNVALITKGEEVCLGQRTVLIRPNPDIANSVYLTYYLLSPEQRNRLLSAASGATVVHVNLPAIRDLEISLPPLPIQRRIAEVLGAYDDAIENNRRRMAILEKMARELYRERFKRSKTRSGRGGRAGRAPLPARTLGEIGIRLESGSRPKGGIKGESEGVASVGAENVIGLGQYNYASEKRIPRDFYESMKRGKIQDRDILLYKDGAYIGRVSLFQDGFPHREAAINEHVFLIHANDETLQYYLFFTLAQERYFKIFQGLNAYAAQPGLAQSSVLGLKVEMPSLEEIREFDRVVSPLVSEIFNLALQSRNLARQRDRLLPRLMSRRLEAGE